MNRPGCYQPERQLLDGIRTRQTEAPFHGARVTKSVPSRQKVEELGQLSRATPYKMMRQSVIPEPIKVVARAFTGRNSKLRLDRPTS